jgi:hypothetical protein
MMMATVITMTRKKTSHPTAARSCVLLLALVALLFPSLSAFATDAAHEAIVEANIESTDESGMGTLAGIVVGVNGKPVAGSRVTLQDAGASHPDVTLTNAQGRFFFADLHHGYYDVRAYAGGAWSEWKHNIEVKTGKQTEVRLQVVTKPKATG